MSSCIMSDDLQTIDINHKIDKKGVTNRNKYSKQGKSISVDIVYLNRIVNLKHKKKISPKLD